MARDLYGEMLSRALNRGAPPGHFPAYIQPGEAALLRSQGGGVAPGGGQYMANGLPSYQFGAGQGTLGPAGLGALAAGGTPGTMQIGNVLTRDPVVARALATAQQDANARQAFRDNAQMTRNLAAVPVDARRAGGAIAAASAPDLGGSPSAAVAARALAAQAQSAINLAAIPDAQRAGGAFFGAGGVLAAPDPNAAAALAAFNAAQRDAVAPQVQQAAQEAVGRTPANAEAQAQAQSHQRNMALQSQYMAANARAQAAQDAAVAAVQDAPGFQPTQDGMRDVTAAMQANRAAVDNATLQNLNMNVILGDPDLTAEGRSERLGAPISEGGIGNLSPGYSISTQSQPDGGMPVDQAIRTVQQRSPDGGYAILNPRPEPGQAVSVPDGYTMGMGGGIIPAAINTAIGMGVPGVAGGLINMGTLLSGNQTLGSMARNAIDSATGETALGRLLAIPGDIRGRIGQALSPITGGIGDALSGAATGLSGLLPGGTPPTSVPQAPPGVQPPAPEVVVDEEQIVPGSEAEPFVRSYDDIPPEIARRLAANVLYGEERIGGLA